MNGTVPNRWNDEDCRDFSPQGATGEGSVQYRILAARGSQAPAPAARKATVAPASLDLDELKSWTELESEGARAFSGTARYTTTMQLPAAHLNGRHALQLDLGEVAEIAEVSVNGTSVGVIWKPPFRANVTGLLRAGANRLEVKVTNLWHNRIVGDLRSPEAGVHTRTNLKHMFRADMELLRSGLLGPVVLRSTVDFDVPIR